MPMPTERNVSPDVWSYASSSVVGEEGGGRFEFGEEAGEGGHATNGSPL
jgi:hypothetical protein